MGIYRIKRFIPTKLGAIRAEYLVEGRKILEEHITMYTPLEDMPVAACEDYSWKNTGGKFNLKNCL